MSTVTARSANGHQTNGAPTHTNGVDKVSKDSRMSKDELKLMVAVLGIYGCYLTSGILQEHIYSYRTATGERFGQTLFLLWVQCVVNVLFAGVAMVVGKLRTHKIYLTCLQSVSCYNKHYGLHVHSCSLCSR
jgi:hypothetical protein